jgi:hypothetical protein
MQIDNSRIINYDTFRVAILQNLQPLKHAVRKIALQTTIFQIQQISKYTKWRF